MYINIDEEFLMKNYFNLSQEEEILNPKEGLTIGNLFYNLYSPYKNYKPNALQATTEKDQILLRIQELDFAINDLQLYLDLHPENNELYELFKKYVAESNKLTDYYSDKYEPLEINKDNCQSYQWYKEPWPWEVKNV